MNKKVFQNQNTIGLKQLTPISHEVFKWKEDRIVSYLVPFANNHTIK